MFIQAMSWSLPVISTNIAGIPEMLSHGREGFLVEPGDSEAGLEAMKALFYDERLRQDMGRAARRRFQTRFELELMAVAYRKLLLRVAPPTILLDMDGTIVDWDKYIFR